MELSLFELHPVLKRITTLKIYFVIHLVCTLAPLPLVFAQDYPYEEPPYPFIEYSKNKFDFYSDSSTFKHLFRKIDTLFFVGKGQIHIVHIGGSHVQTGILTQTIRRKLSAAMPSNQGARGLVFPYKAAKTTNPPNYRTKYKGSWRSCRNVEKKKNCTLGLSGISITTYDSSAEIKIYPASTATHFEFNRVKIFHELGEDAFDINLINNLSVVNRYTDTRAGYTVFYLNTNTDTLVLRFRKNQVTQQRFTLHGILLENDDPGFVYHAVGINGAAVPSFLRCSLLTQHLEQIAPDLIIFGLGINDAYGAYANFSPIAFQNNYQRLLDSIRSAAPQAAILFLTNNDSYYRRRYINHNGTRVEKAMIQLAQRNGAALWNLFRIMGGLGSISRWEDHQLAQRDKVHFNRAGYQLVGDLLFQALLQAYENSEGFTAK